ncbi:MAG TPA: ATP-binding protein [Tepidiformaceae bacterium]
MRPRWLAPESRIFLKPGVGLLVAAIAYAALTAALAPFLHSDAILDVALVYLLLTLVVAALWGYWVGLVSAIAADLLVNFFFVPPLHKFTVQEPANVVALVIFLAVALIGASLLELLRHQIRLAESRAAITATLLEVSQESARAVSPRDALDRLCLSVVKALHGQGCSIVRAGDHWQVLGSVGGLTELTREEQAVAAEALRTNTIARLGSSETRPAIRRAATARSSITFVPFSPVAAERGVLRVRGPISAPPLVDIDRLLRSFADQASVALNRALLAEEAAQTEVLRRADEFKTLILSGVSHDLRTPLTAIRAAVDSLQDEGVDWSAEDRTSFLSTIDTQTDVLSTTVNNLLEMSRLEGGAVKPLLEAIEVDALLEEVRLMTARATADRVVTVESPARLQLTADYGLLVQALINLIENAAKYSFPRGKICIKGDLNGNKVTLTVQDDGPPIPAGDLPYLFERFYRGSKAGKLKGTGLGLAIVKATVELCGGTVQVEPAGGGNAFVIQLPGRTGAPR